MRPSPLHSWLTWLLVLVAGGCQPQPAPPAPGAAAREVFLQQVSAVAAGASTHIDLQADGLGDADLEALAKLPQLTVLALKGQTHFTDAGLARLADLQNLQRLNLGATTVTDQGLAHLAGLHRLTLLRLGSSRVSGPGVAHLAGLKQLQQLILQRAPLTDEGLTHLVGLDNLQSLYVEETQVTTVGLRALMEKLPGLGHVHPHLD